MLFGADSPNVWSISRVVLMNAANWGTMGVAAWNLSIRGDQMRPSKLTVYELFQQQKRYAVPLYQRPYVWNEQDHWAPLWTDIASKARPVGTTDTVAPHFLGAVVLQQIPVFGKQLSCAQIIDGQQRLTTLQIFLAVLRNRVSANLAASIDEESKALLGDLFDDLRGLTQHKGVMADSAVEKFKVWPTNEDRVVFQAVMTSSSRADLDLRFPVELEGKRKKVAKPGPRLVETYRFFDNAVAGLVADEALAAAADNPTLDFPELRLLDALKNALHLVVIELEDGDDPQVIFETLNARGARLLPSDLIRNYVFTEAQTKKESPDQLYTDLWRHFDAKSADGTEGFWKQDVKVGREKRPRLDLFLQHFLVCKTEQEVPLSNLYEKFKDYWKGRKDASVREGLEELRRFGECWHDFQSPSRITNERLQTFIVRLAVLDNSTVMPFLLFLFAEQQGKVSASEARDIIADIESYLVRRWICGLTTKNYNRFFLSTLQEVRKSASLTPSDVRSRLAAATGESRWPSDRDVEKAWLTEPLYERLDSAGIQMLLEAVQEQLMTSKQEKLQILLERLTVEHVLPRKWRDTWPPPAAPAGGDETPEEWRDRLLHTMGNLTLLTGHLNTSISNGPYDAKRGEYTKSLLHLNHYFHLAPDWNEERIVERGQVLLNAAREVWAAPPAAAPA